jgi:hypothetical protein
LNVLIKTNKQGTPIRPVVNNRPAPSYKLAKFLNRLLTQLIPLPYIYALKNTSEMAHVLTTLYVDNQHRVATFDIKDLYVKLPIRNFIDATAFWLSMHHTQPLLTKQTITLIHTALNQDYFQYNQQYYKPQTGIAMG